MTYYGLTVEGELDKASHKPSKEERKAISARERVLDRYLNDPDDPTQKRQSGFADPAAMFR